MDKAISNVGTEREQIGAVMNRLDHTIANLQHISTNLALAKGRIEDARLCDRNIKPCQNAGITAGIDGNAVAGERLKTKYISTISIDKLK